jgi:very-short-patch-repair endonuclease/DNA polymerase III delta prime subunit
MPPPGQDLVRNLFEYVIAYTQIKTPCVRTIVQQPWLQYLGEVPRHETIQFTPPTSSDSAAGWGLLKVGRAKLVEPPPPPNIILDWLEPDWKAQQDLQPVLQRDFLIDDQAVTERFEDSPERVKLFEAWLPAFRLWSEADRRARAALKLFEKLYEVHGRLARENERWELVVGDGFLSHNAAQVDHPLLTHSLQLDFNPRIPEFTVTTVAKSSELYVALLTVLGMDGRHLGALQEELEGGGYSPLGGDETSGFLKGLIQRFGNGVFVESKTATPQDRPSMYRKQVMFLRSRDMGFGRALSAIAQAIDNGASASEAILKVVGAVGNGLAVALETVNDEVSAGFFGDGGHTVTDRIEEHRRDDRKVLFSKESNAEQFEIAHRLRSQKTVLVQGPPGTGKTHTIANLIGDLLAQGKTVLVTSQASKPLRVLRDKIVPELQPLCVSVVSSDEIGRRQLEASVSGITARLGSDSPQRLESEATRLENERGRLLDRIEELRKKLLSAALGEYRTIKIDNGEISPSEAARFVRRGCGMLDWIPGSVKPLANLPLRPEEISALYATNAELTDEDICELRCELPALTDIPSPDDFQALVNEAESLATIDEHPFLRLWERRESSEITEGLKVLGPRVPPVVSVLSSNSEPWTDVCILAGLRGEASQRVWTMLTSFAHEVRDEAIAIESDLVLRRPRLSSAPLKQQQQILDEILASLIAGGGIGRFTLLLKREWKKSIDDWRIEERSPATIEDFRCLKSLCELELRRNDLRNRWTAISVTTAAVDMTNQPELIAYQASASIQRALNWHSREWEPLRNELTQLGLNWSAFESGEPVALTVDGELHTLKGQASKIGELIRIKLLHLRKIELELALEKLAQLSSTSAASVVQDLRHAASSLNPDLYIAAYGRLRELLTLRLVFDVREKLLARLRPIAGQWAESIVQRVEVHGGSVAPNQIEQAWLWKQYSQELDARNAVAMNALQAELDSCQRQVFEVTSKLIDCLAWKHQLNRITNRQDQRTALQGWVDTMRRVGAGTGIQTARFLSEARKLMNQCRGAVPVWIMPMSRVVDSFDPVKTSFDVVIIDEASQCDLGGLIALWMAREVIVVGDHEQVSPDAVGQQVQQIAALQETYLQDIPNKHLYDGQLSLYDLARQSFGGTVCLREHFRCAPEIIQFSNDLSYNRQIKPLRDTTAIRVKPPLIPLCLPDGYRHGDHNDEEALTIASLIVAAIAMPEYAGATFGVIAMIGNTQAALIDKLLRHKLSAAEFDERKIMCGNPAHFQGDERNVIFLSLVDSPKAPGLMHTVAAGARDMYKKRYNVAASRAQDQLWIVHSMDRQSNLTATDLRRRLLDHAHDPSASMDKSGTSAAVDSEFERLVMKDLVAKGFRVTPQWKVGSYRIDLVVEGVNDRLAIECDGDRFHTLENLQADLERQAILERLGWRFVRIRGSEFFRKPEEALSPLYDRLDAMGIGPLGEISVTNQSELSNRVIADARAIRDEWECESEVLDEILNRIRPLKVDVQVEEMADVAVSDLKTPIFLN